MSGSRPAPQITTRQLDPSTQKNCYEFVGRVAPDKIKDKYVGKRMPEPHGQNSIRYYNCIFLPWVAS